MSETIAAPSQRNLILPLALWLSFIVAVAFLMRPALSAMMPFDTAPHNKLWISIAIQWIGLIGIAAYLEHVRKLPLVLWPNVTRSALFHLVSISALLASFLLALIALTKIASYVGLSTKVNAADLLAAIQGRPLLILALTFTAGAVEELVTRVYILPHMASLFNSPRWAIVVSSAVFAMAHFDGQNWVRVVPPFVIGLMLGAHYWKYRNIGAIIAAHFLWDWILLSLISNAAR